MKNKMKLGAKVRSRCHYGIEGVVTKIRPGVSTTDHGMIVIRSTAIKNPCPWHSVGSEEHFVHYQWEKILEII